MSPEDPSDEPGREDGEGGPLRGPTFTVIAPLVGVMAFFVFLAVRGC